MHGWIFLLTILINLKQAQIENCYVFSSLQQMIDRSWNCENTSGRIRKVKDVEESNEEWHFQQEQSQKWIWAGLHNYMYLRRWLQKLTSVIWVSLEGTRFVNGWKLFLSSPKLDVKMLPHSFLVWCRLQEGTENFLSSK